MDYLRFVKNINMCDDTPSICITYRDKEAKTPYLLDDIMNRIKAKYIKDESMDFLALDALDADEMELVNFCNSFSFFSDKKILVVNSANNLSLSKNVLDSILETDAIKLFIFDNKKGHYKHISSKSINVELGKLNETILIRWVIKKFELLNKKIDIATAQYLIKRSKYLEYRSPYTLYDVNSSISKIASTKATTITKSLIDSVFSTPDEHKVFTLSDYVAKRDLKKSIEIYYELHKNGINPHIIVPMFSRLFYQLNMTKQLSDSGLSLSKIGEVIGVRSDFVVRKLVGEVRYFNSDSLLRNLNKCLDCERKIKSEKVNVAAEVELLILELCK